MQVARKNVEASESHHNGAADPQDLLDCQLKSDLSGDE